jgi:hypothetical protein
MSAETKRWIVGLLVPSACGVVGAVLTVLLALSVADARTDERLKSVESRLTTIERIEHKLDDVRDRLSRMEGRFEPLPGTR